MKVSRARVLVHEHVDVDGVLLVLSVLEADLERGVTEPGEVHLAL